MSFQTGERLSINELEYEALGYHQEDGYLFIYDTDNEEVLQVDAETLEETGVVGTVDDDRTTGFAVLESPDSLASPTGAFSTRTVTELDTNDLSEKAVETVSSSTPNGISANEELGYFFVAESNEAVVKVSPDGLSTEGDFRTSDDSSPRYAIVGDNGEGYSSDSDGEILKFDADDMSGTGDSANASDEVEIMVLTPDYLISGANDGVIEIWDRSDLSLVDTFDEHSEPVQGMAYNEVTGLVYSSGNDSGGQMIVWDVETLDIVNSVDNHDGEGVGRIVIDSDNGVGWSVGRDDSLYSFELEMPDPLVQTGNATDVGHDQATLNGEVISLGDEDEVEAYFEYRETGAADWIETSKQTISTAQTFDETVTELDNDTDYEFRAVIDDTGGETLDTGDTLTFTTEKQVGSVATDPASNVTGVEAQLNGELTDLGDYDEADVGFRYRETGAEDWIETEFDTVTETGAFDETVTELDNDTEYEFKAVAEFNGEEETGDTLTFTTDEELDIVDINEKSPLDQSEYLSETTSFEADIEFNEDGDYYIDIEIDGEREYREEFNDVTDGQTETVETTIEIGFKTYDWDWVGQKQVDGE